MGVNRYQDLVCWQLADELKKQVYALVARSGPKVDFKFCGQLKDAAGSGPANISEAFGYYGHGLAARHARIARSSLIETQNHLCDGVDRHHWTDGEVQPLLALANRAIGATTRWLAYLMSSDAPLSKWQVSAASETCPKPADRRDKRRRRRTNH